ncbi:hypothetical protein V1527DRAFT_496028 [Lipomyces starkeyi]
MTRSRSIKRKTERDPLNIQRYTEFCDRSGELHISFSKANGSAIIIYEHNGHSKTPKFAITEEVLHFIKAQKGFPPRQLYQKLIQMADDPQRQQVYNVSLSFTRQERERDAANDFRSAQLLVVEHDCYRLIEGLQEPGVSLAFITPCFSDCVKYSRPKMTEVILSTQHLVPTNTAMSYTVFLQSTFLYLCLYPIFYWIRVASRKRQEGSQVDRVVVALRGAGLHPNVVHTDNDFAGI